MKNIYAFFAIFMGYSMLLGQQQNISYQINPENFNEDESITITIDGNSINESLWNVNNHALYLWSWSYDLNDDNGQDAPTNGSWTNSDERNKLIYNTTTDTYSFTLTPTTFYNRTSIGKIGFLIKAKDGTGDKKSQDILVEVGKFKVDLITPLPNSNTVIDPGQAVNIIAHASTPSLFTLQYNNVVSHETNTASDAYNYTLTPTESGSATLIARNPIDNQEITASFNITINSDANVVTIPDWIKPGINYLADDETRAGLAIIAPGKAFIHVIGSFNNWQINDAYKMNRDTTNPDLFWLEITDLTPQEIYTFQYQTNDNIKVADPYSPVVLSPYDDPYIPSNTYPNLPAYPSGQDFEVSVLQTGQQSYDWQMTNFNRPEKENLIIYEVLLRDFTTEKNFQSLIDKIPYIKSLNVNAIELLPIMEFEGNNSWGYNPSFHYALDKAYGTQNKFKEFVDTAHANGLAVILDIALNHATGRNPYVRLWNEDENNDGYGPVRADNPFFNTVPKHSYNVFEDFNHQSEFTQYYVKRVIQHWIQEYNIDGFRWDLTKGFTQNCTVNDQGCTNAYQQDRVDILKQYADYQWEVDATSYVIFEHLGGSEEEKEWANYKIDEGKGIMPWNNLNAVFNQNTMGYEENSNLNYIHHEAKDFDKPLAMSYGESHDEERLMYKNLAYGNSSSYYDVKELSTALDRQKTFGAIMLTVPGPKMIWQFGELGYEYSINLCVDGTISNECRTSPKPIAFELNYDVDTERKALYDTWATILDLRKNNEVFKTDTYDIKSGDLLPVVSVYNDNLPTSELKNVLVVANFNVTTQNVTPNFPYTGTWYNLMDNTSLNVMNTSHTLTLQPGEFRIFGNQPNNNLGTVDIAPLATETFKIIDNPAQNGIIKVRYNLSNHGQLEIYDLQGRKLKAYNINKNSAQTTLDTGLKPGVYILNFNSNQQTFSEKVIIK